MTHEELCRHIVDSTPDAITHADRHGIIQLWNTGAETLFGYSECEALGRSLNLIIPDRLRQRHRDGYHRVMTTGQTHHGHELLAVPGLHNDGTRISLEFSIIMLRDAAGEPNGISAIPATSPNTANTTARYSNGWPRPRLSPPCSRRVHDPR